MEQMRDLRNRTAEGFTEGDTDDLLMDSPESLEDMVIQQMEIETLQKAIQTFLEIQRERLHLYFFEGDDYEEDCRQTGNKSECSVEIHTEWCSSFASFFLSGN